MHVFGRHRYKLSALVNLLDKYQTEYQVTKETSCCVLKNKLYETRCHAFSPIFLDNLYKQGCAQTEQVRVYLTTGEGYTCFSTTEGSTQIHIMSYFRFESEANDEGTAA